MLSYRHAFHAGNFADVHKHIVLTLLLQALLRKEAPLCYVETHAGAGAYDLRSEQARKKSEYLGGIRPLWECADVPASVQPYLAAVGAFNKKGKPLRFYPGSPRIAGYFLRQTDRMVLAELHPSEFPLLQAEFAHDRRVAIHRQDGYALLKAVLPPRERRGLVLIDPAYERKDEFDRVVAALQGAYKRWPTGVFVVWYPIQTRNATNSFHRRIMGTGIRRILVADISIRPEDVANRLNGSGMIIVNPPWQIDGALESLQPWLWEILAAGRMGRSRVEWLAPE